MMCVVLDWYYLCEYREHVSNATIANPQFTAIQNVVLTISCGHGTRPYRL